MAGTEKSGPMGADWTRIRDVFELALDVEVRERASFVAAACGDDELLRREVDALLDEHVKAGGFLSGPVAYPTLRVEGVPSVERVLVEAVAHGADRRVAFLDRACSGDGELRAAVEVLLGDEPLAATSVATARSDESGGLLEGFIVDGKYKIEEPLGAGGMGAVYRARHLQLERAVALKVIRADLVADPLIAERFRREAVAVARLRHPHIVTVHDYGVAAGVGAFIVMELLEGHSLHAELVRRGRFELDDALTLMRRVCAAVAVAHGAGVVHRDLKPENIFLEMRRETASVKVLDFGLAKLDQTRLTGGHRLTLGGAVIGTPAYLSPEQCRGEEADARSDVYSLGCMLYELLTGRTPFRGPNIWSLVYQHVNDEPRPPSSHTPGLTPEIDGAVLRALAKDKDDRYQTVEAFAAALSLSPTEPTGARPNNLQEAMTRFIGRDGQVAEVRDWLRRTRLVSLVGPGGIGKTRLALEVAASEVSSYEHGVWMVELASLADPESLVQAVASALGVREQGGRLTTATLEASLRDKRILLVLDNCEHVIEACARLTMSLLASCGGLRVLATSREALAVPGEAVWPVPALALDTADSEAVRLFVDRAALAKPSFDSDTSAGSIVAELCRRLEGIPLAIELAAARVKVLSVDQILARLDDRFRLLTGGSRTAPVRQHALQATLDWSHDLLTDEERSLFRRLSVFAGGWTLEAAEAVAPGATTQRLALNSRYSVFHILTRLVDKSLVTVADRLGAARYGMLEMVREYAAERLARSGDADQVRRRHAAFFTVEAERSRQAISEGTSGEWLDRMEMEHDNVRAALTWLHAHDPGESLRLAAAAHPFRELRGHLTESRRVLETEVSRDSNATAMVRAEAYLALGRVAALQGDLAQARGYYEQGLPLAKEIGDMKQVAKATYIMGTLANSDGDLEASRAHLEESLAIGRAAGYDNVVGPCLNSLGELARLAGDWRSARNLYEQAVAVVRGKRDDHFLIIPLCNLGAVACEDGDPDAARACFEEALVAARSLGSTELVSYALDGLAAVAVKEGSCERAGRLAGVSGELLDAIGATLTPIDLDFRERYLADARERFGEAALDAAVAEGRAMTEEQAIEYATET